MLRRPQRTLLQFGAEIGERRSRLSARLGFVACIVPFAFVRCLAPVFEGELAEVKPAAGIVVLRDAVAGYRTLVNRRRSLPSPRPVRSRLSGCRLGRSCEKWTARASRARAVNIVIRCAQGSFVGGGARDVRHLVMLRARQGARTVKALPSVLPDNAKELNKAHFSPRRFSCQAASSLLLLSRRSAGKGRPDRKSARADARAQ